jgi:hypothetical protein
MRDHLKNKHDIIWEDHPPERGSGAPSMSSELPL